jgi:Lon-like ATP-dependent protease
VNWYSEVFDLLFPGLDHEAARMVWKEALAKPETLLDVLEKTVS